MERTFAARCYNSYRAKLNLISKIKIIEPNLTEAQILYSLKGRFIHFKESIGQTIEHVVNKEWQCIQSISKRGKNIYELFNMLGLGQSGISTLMLALKAKIKALIFDYIRSDIENHRMLVRNTNPQPAVIELLAIHRLTFQAVLVNIARNRIEEVVDNLLDFEQHDMNLVGHEGDFEHENLQENQVVDVPAVHVQDVEIGNQVIQDVVEDGVHNESQDAEMDLDEESVDEEEQESDKENEPSQQESDSSQVSDEEAKPSPLKVACIETAPLNSLQSYLANHRGGGGAGLRRSTSSRDNRFKTPNILRK